MPPPRRKTAAVGRNAPVPVQWAEISATDLQTPAGIARLNQQLSQFATALNTGNGVLGPVVLPNGADVNGATVTGLGAPSGPSDAVSLSHASSNYGAPAVGPQLDVGGKNALKGLSNLYLQFNQFKGSGTSGTITLAKLTSGGTNGSITVVNGLITAFTNPT